MHLPSLFLAMVLATPAALPAQDAESFDPAALMQGVQDVLSRTPDREVDGLFQALHGAMARPDEADAICGLFDQGAAHGIDGLNDVAMRLGEDSRQRFAEAVANVVVAGLQGTPQPYDRDAAAQALKSNGARAAMLHDGFTAGFGEDATREMRCRSLDQMLDVLAQRPQSERVLVTRLLLEQGLQRIPMRRRPARSSPAGCSSC
jgi:hypothetical protein